MRITIIIIDALVREAHASWSAPLLAYVYPSCTRVVLHLVCKFLVQDVTRHPHSIPVSHELRVRACAFSVVGGDKIPRVQL